ncbi:lysophospholipid acyltransferase family protein [Humisphaera borealis]|uniref:lysophospholipid acyltransferase family protein n=1 Tax=Humisphaera borealis TaxID=2807512 RepID=UPI0019D0B9C0|nr:lysophospholipid acyltransferase family protein [Humisphaera borealis]
MIAGLLRLVTGAQARWKGSDPVRPDGVIPQRIFFANHTSNLDAPVIWAALPTPVRRMTRPVAAKDYWEAGPIRRKIARDVFRAVLIERKKVTRENNPLRIMEEAMESGDSLIIFPEGTRATDDDATVGEFKPGLWHLAKKRPDVELVPVYLENLNRILPKGDFILVPLLAAVTFGTPIRPNEGEDKPTFLARARESVATLRRRAEDGK